MKKSLITKIILVAASVLSLVFLALGFVEGVSGYQLLSNISVPFKFGADFWTILVYLLPLIILLASIVLLVFSVLALLGELNVIKSEKLLAVSAKINFIVSIVLCAITAAAFLIILIKGYGLAVGCILLLVLAVAALVATILEKKWSKA